MMPLAIETTMSSIPPIYPGKSAVRAIPAARSLPEEAHGLADIVLKSFAQSLGSVLEAGPPPDEAFVDHILLGVSSYLQRTVGTAHKPMRGGLAPWQERRAKEMMETGKQQELSIGDLAAACGLSITHFSRAFRQSCGTTPHRWMMSKRLEKVQALLQETEIPLASIAVECGFADQAHLTNAFSKQFGSPPGAMRRLWRNNAATMF
jgi:AraC family transcriptional regulator